MGFLDGTDADYGDPLATAREAGSGIFNKPVRGDWMTQALNKAYLIGEERKRQEEQARKDEEERQRMLLKQQQMEQERQAKLLADADKLAGDPGVSFMPDWHSNLYKKNQGKYGNLPLAVRRAVAERRGVPGEVFDAMPEMPSTPEDDSFIAQLEQYDRVQKPNEGFFSGGVRRGVTKALGGGKVAKFAGEMAGSLTHSLEVPASAANQGIYAAVAAGADALGADGVADAARADAKRTDTFLGTNFRTNDWKTNTAQAIESAADIASLGTSGAAIGKPALKAAGVQFGKQAAAQGAKQGFKQGAKDVLKEVAAEALGNAALDVPTTIASLRLRGLDDSQIAEILPQVLAGDLAGALMPVAGKPLKAASKVPLAPELAGGAAAYGAAKSAQAAGAPISDETAAVAGGVGAGIVAARHLPRVRGAISDALDRGLGRMQTEDVAPDGALPMERAPRNQPELFTPNESRVTEPSRGKQALISRIEMETRKGRGTEIGGTGLNPETGQLAIEFIDSLPDDYVEGLASSWLSGRTVGELGGRPAAGSYNPEMALVAIAKGAANEDDRVIYHEIFHHLEQFVDDADIEALKKQWQRDMRGPGGQKLVEAQPALAAAEAGQRLGLEDARLADEAYRFNGGFREWFAEKMADKSLRDIEGMPPEARNAFQKVAYHVKNLLLGAYNWLLNRGERDAAERVYQKIRAGGYDASAARDLGGEPLGMTARDTGNEPIVTPTRGNREEGLPEWNVRFRHRPDAPNSIMERAYGRTPEEAIQNAARSFAGREARERFIAEIQVRDPNAEGFQIDRDTVEWTTRKGRSYVQESATIPAEYLDEAMLRWLDYGPRATEPPPGGAPRQKRPKAQPGERKPFTPADLAAWAMERMHAGRAATDLTRLEKRGYDVTDAREILEEYQALAKRPEVPKKLKSAVWDELRDAVERIGEKPPGETPRAAPDAPNPPEPEVIDHRPGGLVAAGAQPSQSTPPPPRQQATGAPPRRGPAKKPGALPPLNRTSPYTILGLTADPNLTLADIKAAYRAQMMRYHPDVNKAGSATADAQAINSAYSMLQRAHATPGQPTNWGAGWQSPPQPPPGGAQPGGPAGGGAPPVPPRAGAAPPPPSPPPPPAPPPNHAIPQMDEALDYAAQQTDAKRVPGSGFLDPARKWANTVGGRIGHTAWVAGENYTNMLHGLAVTESQKLKRILDPLVGDTGPRLGPISAQDVGRAAAEAAPPLAGYFGADLAGLDEDRQQQLGLVGLMGTALISQKISHGGLRRTWADGVKFKSAQGRIFRASGRSGDIFKGKERLLDMIENPHLYDFTPEQKAAIDQVQRVRDDWLAALNAHEAAAGLPITPPNAANSLMHLWEERSLKKALNSSDSAVVTQISTPGIGQKVTPTGQRTLRDPRTGAPITTLREAKAAYPGLKLAYGADPVRLLRAQYLLMTRRMGDAVTFRGLQRDPAHFDRSAILAQEYKAKRDALLRQAGTRGTPRQQVAVLKNQARLMDQARKQYKAAAQTLRDQGWVPIPGSGDALYSPEIGKFVESVYTKGGLSDHFIARVLDRSTTELRQLIYTADFSAWTMQGLMAAMQSPSTTIANSPHLAAASLLGDKYLDWFISRNKDAWKEFSLAGGMSGGEFGVEDRVIRTAADMPGLRHVEKAGFNGFLPVMRFLQWDNARQAAAWYEKLPAAVKNSYVGPRATEAARLGVKYGATGATAYTIDQFLQDHEAEDWERALALAMIGGAAAVGSHNVEKMLGKKVYDNLQRVEQRETNIRAAKMTNRTSGILNRPQMGITQHQSQLERIAVRSPGILRNTLAMVKLALFNPGPEGAQAAFYLARTGLLSAGALYGAQVLAGKETSLDPSDSNSPFNPRRFGRASLQGAGTVSESNPWLSLARAVLSVPSVEGDDKGSLRLWTPESAALGLEGWFSGRLADVTGKFVRPFVDGQLYDVNGLPRLYAGQEPENIADLTKMLPTSVQEAGRAGWFEHLAGDIPVAEDLAKRDPNYNTRAERILGPTVSVAGGNFTPESRAQEGVRRTAAAIRQQFPKAVDKNQNGVLDTRDLNTEDAEAFRASPEGKALQAFRDETRALNPSETQSQIDLYRQAKDKVQTDHLDRLKALEAAVADGSLPKLRWRSAYQDENKRYQIEKGQVDKAFSTEVIRNDDGSKHLIYDPKTGKAREMNVLEYMRRGTHPEDEAVDGYYALLDKYTGVDGKPDFERLEQAQSDYLAGLAPEMRQYVEERLGHFKGLGPRDTEGNPVDLPTVKEFTAAKDITRPFFEIRDTEFEKFKATHEWFQQFNSYNDLMKYAAEEAAAQGMTQDQYVAAYIAKKKGFTRFLKNVTKAETRARRGNNALELSLRDFYGRAPLNWKHSIASSFGDDSYSESRSTSKPTASQMRRFANRYGPSASQAFGISP